MEKVRIFKLGKYYDNRGHLSPIWRNDYDNLSFVEDRLSVSNKGVLRGLHGDKVTGKLFIPITGVFQFFAYGIFTKERISYELFCNDFDIGIYVPPNYINGHLCMTDNCIMLYKWTNYYKGPENQFTVRYDDPTLGIHWQEKNPILSDRDKNGLSLLELEKNYDKIRRS